MNKIYLLFLVFTIPSLTPSFSQKMKDWYYNIDKQGMFLEGYDVVAYHTENKAQLGTEKHQVNLGGVTYQFSNGENKSLFKKSPEKYMPAFGGWCTFLMGIDKNVFPPTRSKPDPENFMIIDGKLYLFGKSPQQNFKEVFQQRDKKTILKRAKEFWESREKLALKTQELPEGLNPHARMELLEWMPFMGDWESELTWWADTSGQNKLNYTGNWYFRFGYYGYCIQDDYVGSAPNNISGTPFGPAIRGYDPANDKWHMTYIPVNQPRDKTWLMRGKFIANGIIEGTMELDDPSGNKVLQKVRLESKSKDEFIWSADWSYDQGKTWIKNIGYSVNRRVKDKT